MDPVLFLSFSPLSFLSFSFITENPSRGSHPMICSPGALLPKFQLLPGWSSHLQPSRAETDRLQVVVERDHKRNSGKGCRVELSFDTPPNLERRMSLYRGENGFSEVGWFAHSHTATCC